MFESSEKIQSIKVVTNDSIGTFFLWFIFTLPLKLPAPPRAVVLVLYCFLFYECLENRDICYENQPVG